MATTKWILDPTHSELGFKIKHLMISNISGSLKNFQIVVETEDEDDFSTAKVELTADMASISTNNEQRDAHLRNSDFFDVDKHPELIFRSTRVEMLDNQNFRLHGDLTLKGITKPVILNVEFSNVTKDPWGGERAGFVITGKINRSHWGVNFNSVLETGGLALSDEVRINSEVQLVKQDVGVTA
jgi:polyisoprenoid-binding protein YceI